MSLESTGSPSDRPGDADVGELTRDVDFVGAWLGPVGDGVDERGCSGDVDRGLTRDILAGQHGRVTRGGHLDVLLETDFVLKLVPRSQGVREEHGLGSGSPHAARASREHRDER